MKYLYILNNGSLYKGMNKPLDADIIACKTGLIRIVDILNHLEMNRLGEWIKISTFN